MRRESHSASPPYPRLSMPMTGIMEAEADDEVMDTHDESAAGMASRALKGVNMKTRIGGLPN